MPLLQVRKWDAATGTNVDTFNDRKAVACVAVPQQGRDIVAFAGAARALRVWDPRMRHSEDSVSKQPGFAAQIENAGD